MCVLVSLFNCIITLQCSSKKLQFFIKNKLYYDTFLEYKNGEGELKNLSLSQTELKKLFLKGIKYDLLFVLVN